MPATSEKLRRFMGAELGRKRAGEKTQTGMSEQQLSDFAGGIKRSHKKRDVPGQSLVDVEVIEGAGHESSVKARVRLSDPRLGRGMEVQAGDPMPVCVMGPDTPYESLELDPDCYGHDWNPMSANYYTDPINTANWRRREQREYESSRKMGAQEDRFDHQRRYARDIDPEFKVDDGDSSYTPLEADTDKTYGTKHRSVKY